MPRVIPYGSQSINDDDISAVIDVLRSPFLTQGNVIPEFEAALSERFDSVYSVVMNSATSALHAAYLALGIEKGDLVWTSPNTFVATSNAALLAGAQIDFVDIDAIDLNLDVEKLENKLVRGRENGNLPKVVTPVHFAGRPCNMKKIHELSQEYGFKVLEDASHAVGARTLNSKIGACEFSDITVFSFHPVKIITTGEGGAALTRCPSISKKLRLYRSHGITKEISDFVGPSPGPWYYEQTVLGLNYRMTDIQAALGITQLLRLDEFLVRRHAIADYYNIHLQNLNLDLPSQLDGNYSSWHLYVIQLKDEKVHDHLRIFKGLQQDGIGVQLHYMPVHLQPYYRQLGFEEGDFPIAENYAKLAISIPIFPALTEISQMKVINKIKKRLSVK